MFETRQLCLGVHHLHENKSILHRDIKPNNVFLMDSKKIVQLGDFGLAKAIHEGDEQVKAEVSAAYREGKPYTRTNKCVGSHNYPARERQLGTEADRLTRGLWNSIPALARCNVCA